jgi:hypothetical protein
MAGTADTSPQPSAPQKTNPWLIVIAAAVALCCACTGITGLIFAFGGPVLDALGLLHSLLPNLLV